MILFEVEPLDLGADVRAIGIELIELGEDREPVRGEDAARVWGRIIPALAGTEAWALDFFSHLDRVRDYCKNHAIRFRDAANRCVVIPALDQATLESLVVRFEAETFGARAGALVTEGDAALESDLASRGADAYQLAFPNYYFCGICDFEDGSLVVLSKQLSASEIVRIARRALDGLDIEVRLGSS
ncbi:MAG: hypothetical protein WA734_17395 [Candidatus Acidiferrales bacterium]